MAVKATLITPEEVKELAKIDQHVQPCDINDIRQVEKVMARDCLGKDFYNAIVDDLNDYSTAAKWTNTTTAAGQIRLYGGNYYRSLTSTSAEPTLKSDWEVAPKFKTDCYNDLWCEVLGRYVALLVVQNSLPPISTPITASGTVKKRGEGFDAASEQSVLRLQSWLASQVSTAFENLHEYLTDSDSTCYSLYKGKVDGECGCSSSTGPDLTNAEFHENGSVNFYTDGYCCTNKKSCSCPACVEKNKTKTNRYVIA